MSTTAYAMPLHSVPNAPPNTKARFAALLAMREAANKAFDKALSVPRSAIRWAMSLFQRWADATASVGAFTWLGQQARSATSLVRAAGIAPVAVAVLSTPPLARAVTGGARLAGNGLLKAASAAWSGLKTLLARCGNTGTRITGGLAHAGANIAGAVRAAAQHPIMVPIAHALRATLALVRPISQGFVAHRMLGLLVPILWLRTLIGLLVMPLLVDTGLAHGVRDIVNPQPAEPNTNASNGNSRGAHTGADDSHVTGNKGSDGNHNGLLIDALTTPVSTEVPKPTNGSHPSEGADEDHFLNRAARRAQQREDAQAKRLHR
jgi:hypothetical protein